MNMSQIAEILNDVKEPLAVIGLILIGMTHPDATIQAAVVGGLTGIIMGRTGKESS